MNQLIPINDDIFWVGVNDRETHLFEALWPLPRGISYNAYLIRDKKTALIDTVKAPYASKYIHKIEELLGEGQKIDYLIVNHMEPDHSGSIEALLNAYPDLKIVCNKKTVDFLKGFYDITENLKIIDDAEEISLGKHTLRFYLTPMVHWPETMMTYETKNKILFSGDAFGGFGALDAGIFDDQINIDYYQEEIRRYYTNIVAKYHSMVIRAINKLGDLEIKTIAATHGPVWRTHPEKIIEDYLCWSKCETTKGVVIAYGSMYGHTKMMAERLSKELANRDVKNIKVFDVSKTHLSYIFNEIWQYKIFVLGSCTYNTDLFPPMAQLLSFIKASRLKNHSMGIFGTYSWSGGAVKALKEFGESGIVDLIEPVIEAKHAPKDDSYSQIEQLAENIVKQLE
ncbi:MAG: FprA family A-type flavoprotein [Asgard group archaeon]|nr:FprA family A-type flavoprotein [Asgard group archaeon]